MAIPVQRVHLFLGILVALVVLLGGVIGGVYGLGDPRWAGREALAQAVDAARVERERAATADAAARKELAGQVQANREAVLLIQQALDSQTTELRRLLDRMDSQPVHPPRRRAP